MTGRTPSTNQDDTPVDYDLSCWYLNARRVIELVGADSVTPDIRRVTALANIDDGLRANFIISALKDRLTEWLHAANPPTLGQLLVKGKLLPGVLFTHYDRYFCKGLSKVGEALNK